MDTAAEYISALNLSRHPEGGWYRESWRSNLEVSVPWSADKRSAGTSIYFLLESPGFSSFHRIKSDELWHFYDGSAIEIIWIEPEGNLYSCVIGRNHLAGERLLCVVPAGCWFAARVIVPDSFALVGCTVSPGFDFADFELAIRAELIRQYPEHKALIQSLTR